MANSTLPQTGLRYLAYVRVSTQQQEEQGYGADAQIAGIRAYAARHGLLIGPDDWYQDDVSGDLESRPQLDKALAQLRGRNVAGIIVDRPDRLARKMWIGMRLLEEMHTRGLDVHFATLGRIENTPEARFQVSIFFSVGQLDKESLLRKLNGAKRAKVTHADDPRPLNMGIAPLGYSFVGKKRETAVEINEAEAPIVRRIFALYGAGTSITTIVETLAREQVPTVEDMRPRKKKKGGIKRRGFAQWDRYHIHRIVTSPIYKGKMPIYGSIANVERADGTIIKRAKKRRDDPSIVWLDVPAIIEAADWDRVQQMRNDRRREATGAHTYLLAHRLRCVCGYTRAGWLQSRPQGAPPETPRRPYYRCTAAGAGRALCRCKNGMLSADAVDAAVWEYVDTVLLDPENLAEAYNAQEALQAQVQEASERERERLRQHIADIEEQRLSLLRAELGGRYSAVLIARQHDELDALDAQYKQELAGLEQKIVTASRRVKQWESIEQLQRTIREDINTSTVAGRREVLEILGVTVVAGKGIVHIAAEVYAGQEPATVTIAKRAKYLQNSQSPPTSQQAPIAKSRRYGSTATSTPAKFRRRARVCTI